MNLHQERINVSIKKLHEDAKIPTYAHPTDAGMDLYAVDDGKAKMAHGCHIYTEYDTGIAVAIPEGYVGLVFPRSSISKQTLSLANSVAVIDANYRGPIKLRFRVFGDIEYTKGDRIGQLVIMPYPKVCFTEVDELDDTDRGDGGFGSSGS